MMRDGELPFSNDFQTARDRFLAAADRLGVRAASIPGIDPSITADVARLGSPEAPAVLVVCSGGRGLSSLVGCGAALCGLSREMIMALPAQVGLVLVHAANTSGPVWSPARPFLATTPAPADSEWEDGLLASAEGRFQDYAEDEIEFSTIADRTLSSMAQAAFDRKALAAAVSPMLAQARAITILDVRTGPLPFRQHAIYTADPEGSAGRQRGERWLHATPPPEDTDPDAYAAENCGAGLTSDNLIARRTRLFLEFGTDSMAGLLGGEGRSRGTSAYPASEDWRINAAKAIRTTLRVISDSLLTDVQSHKG